jgi:hypothetical protein
MRFKLFSQESRITSVPNGPEMKGLEVSGASYMAYSLLYYNHFMAMTKNLWIGRRKV